MLAKVQKSRIPLWRVCVSSTDALVLLYVYFVFVFVRFFVNDFSTTRGLIHAKFCMRAYSGSGCLLPIWRSAAHVGEKGGNEIFVTIGVNGEFLHFGGF